MGKMRCSLILPVAKNGKVILARRSLTKQPFPNTWVCAVGGKANESESFEQAALREMKEELGVAVPVKHIVNFSYNKEFEAEFSVFTTVKPLEKDLKLDASEIQYLKEFSVDEIKKMMSESPNEFAPTFRAALEAVLSAEFKPC